MMVVANDVGECPIVDINQKPSRRRKSRPTKHSKIIHVATKPLLFLLVLLASLDNNKFNAGNVSAFTTPIIPFSSLSSSRWEVSSKGRTATTSTRTTKLHYTSNYMHYQILGVTKYSTKADIKRAYRRLAKQYHPGKYG